MRARCPQVTIKEMVYILFCTELLTDCADRDLSFFKNYDFIAQVCICEGRVCHSTHLGSQSRTCSSLSPMWVLEVVLKSLGLVASTLTPWAMSLIQILDFRLLSGNNPVLLYCKVYFTIFYSYILCAYACVWRPEHNLQLLILSFHHVSPRHWTHDQQ